MPVVDTASPRVDDPPVGDTRNGVAMTGTTRGTAASYETFGRLMTLIFDMSPLSGSTAAGVSVWERLGGGFGVSWTGGPHAAEVVAALTGLAADDEVTTVVSPGDVTDIVVDEDAAFLRLRDVVVELRPHDTIGVEAEWAQAVTSLRELRLPS